MKRVLFVLPHMLCGGVEKSLLSLINEMSNKEYEIDILLLKKEGEFLKLIPNNVNLYEININEEVRNELMIGGKKKLFKYYLQKGKFLKLFRLVRNIIFNRKMETLLYNFKKIECVEKRYDIAVCYHIHMPFLIRYVSEKINAERKYAWVHNDFKGSKFNIKKYYKYLLGYNKFFTVSNQLYQEFIEIFPDFKNKTDIAYNIISDKLIIEQSNEYYPKEFENMDDTIKILTIGRLEPQKGYELAIESCKYLKDKGYKFRWYVLGNGQEKESIEKKINQYNLKDFFILLGIRINPYPYIKHSDIYVQPSKHEGFGIVISEAKILQKPIIATDFIGAKDQIKDKYNGLIIKYDYQQLNSALETLMKNGLENEKCQFFQENLKDNKMNIENKNKILNFFRE